MRGFLQRIIVGIAGTVALGLIAACPPKPPVNPGPDVSDAAPPVTCSAACDHVGAVCPASRSGCDQRCPRVSTNDPGYAPCLLAAASCADLKCDAATRAAGAKR